MVVMVIMKNMAMTTPAVRMSRLKQSFETTLIACSATVTVRLSLSPLLSCPLYLSLCVCARVSTAVRLFPHLYTNTYLFVVEIGVIDTRRAGNEHIDTTWFVRDFS